MGSSLIDSGTCEGLEISGFGDWYLHDDLMSLDYTFGTLNWLTWLV